MMDYVPSFMIMHTLQVQGKNKFTNTTKNWETFVKNLKDKFL